MVDWVGGNGNGNGNGSEWVTVMVPVHGQVKSMPHTSGWTTSETETDWAAEQAGWPGWPGLDDGEIFAPS